MCQKYQQVNKWKKFTNNNFKTDLYILNITQTLAVMRATAISEHNGIKLNIAHIIQIFSNCHLE